MPDRTITFTQEEFVLMRHMFNIFFESGKGSIETPGFMDLFTKLEMRTYRSKLTDYASWEGPIMD